MGLSFKEWSIQDLMEKLWNAKQEKDSIKKKSEKENQMDIIKQYKINFFEIKKNQLRKERYD